jgi:hypothetical protein
MGYWSGWKATNANDRTVAYDDFDFEDDEVFTYVSIFWQSFTDDTVIRDHGAPVTISVTRRSAQQEFVVSLDVLCSTSTFFRSFYETPSRSPLSIKLTSCDPKLFELVVFWLQDQEIDFGQFKTVQPLHNPVRHRRRSKSELNDPTPEMVPRWCWSSLANLWLLADRLGMPKLQNCVMVALKPMVEGLDDSEKRAFAHFMCDHPESTSSTLIRKLALAQLAVGPKTMVLRRMASKGLQRQGFMKELRTYCDGRTSDYPEDKKVEVYFLPVRNNEVFCNKTSGENSDE